MRFLANGLNARVSTGGHWTRLSSDVAKAALTGDPYAGALA